jgi:Lectin C-type domain
MMVTKYYMSKNLTGTWSEAMVFCKANQMELARFRDRQDVDGFLSLYQKQMNQFSEKNIIIGGWSEDPLVRRNFYWYETGQLINFTLPWLPGEPNNRDLNENCMLIGTGTQSNSTLGFIDFPCQYKTKFRFVCQETLPV